MVINTEKTVEELTYGSKARSGVGDEKYNNDYSSRKGNKSRFVSESVGEKVRYGVSFKLFGIYSYALSDYKPVEVCTESESESRPERLCDTRSSTYPTPPRSLP